MDIHGFEKCLFKMNDWFELNSVHTAGVDPPAQTRE
jgi:hypothetical protein